MLDIRKKLTEEMLQRSQILSVIAKALIREDHTDNDKFEGVVIDSILKEISRYPDIARVLDIYVDRQKDGTVVLDSLGVQILGKIGKPPLHRPEL